MPEKSQERATFDGLTQEGFFEDTIFKLTAEGMREGEAGWLEQSLWDSRGLQLEKEARVAEDG